MAEANISIPVLRDRDNSTESKLPTGELAEAIELLEQVIGILDSLEAFADPNVDLSGFLLERHLRRMATAAGGASHLVTEAQAFLIEAKEIESEVSHG